MNRIAIETATTACAIGVRTTKGAEIVRVLDVERRHTEVLSAGLGAALRELGLAPRDVDVVVVDQGPGLFTGLRVGVATANAFAQAIGARLVAVTSLELLAHGAWRAGVRGRLVSVVDARRGEVFTQSFELGDEVTALEAASVANPRTTVITWATNGVPVTFTGDGVARYERDFNAVPNGTLVDQMVPPMHEALALATTRVGVPLVHPLYLRDADAVANFSTRDRQP